MLLNWTVKSQVSSSLPFWYHWLLPPPETLFHLALGHRILPIFLLQTAIPQGPRCLCCCCSSCHCRLQCLGVGITQALIFGVLLSLFSATQLPLRSQPETQYIEYSQIVHPIRSFSLTTSLNKFKMIKIIPSIFSDHSALKLEISCTKKVKKPTNMWRLNNILLKMDWVKEEIKGDKKIRRDKREWQHNIAKLLGCSESSHAGEFLSLQASPKKQGKPQENNLTYILRARKRTQATQTQQKKGNNKNKSRIEWNRGEYTRKNTSKS